MTLICLICVLVLEQFKALPAASIQSLLDAFADYLERNLNGGAPKHGLVAWLLGALLPSLAVLAIHAVLEAMQPLLAFAFDVAVLYVVLGFRQFSHYYSDIQLALQLGELDRARQLLETWTGYRAGRLSSAEVARLAIENGILAAHRHVFAPLFWCLALGPAGAVLYRLGQTMTERWNSRGAMEVALGSAESFGQFARRAFHWLNWLPARMTAVTFAIVGDFEDAIHCWRTQAELWSERTAGILLASGAGALGIHLGQPIAGEFEVEARPELGLGDDADVEHLQSAIGLVWRALVLCLILLGLLLLASWSGSWS